MDKVTYQFFVSMDVKEEFENLFNEVYDKEHIPELLNVPGVEWVTRLKLEPGEMMIAGQSKSLNTDGVAKYLAIYGLSDPKAISSKEWALAGEKGRWLIEVRPHTLNRSHILRKVI